MKHKPVKQWELAKNKERKVCPRCGNGTYMARHKDRLYCGKCHLTIFEKSEES
jgi:ribosomal protein S27AE